MKMIYRITRCESASGLLLRCLAACVLALLSAVPVHASAADTALDLSGLIEEALRNNPEILAYRSRELAAQYRVPQSESLPDPMFMVGYLNQGTDDLYTFNDKTSPDSQWMFTLSQAVPFPGKRSLREEASLKEAGAQTAVYNAVRLKVIEKIRTQYYDLFLAHKKTDFIRESRGLFSRVEEAALSRYSSGMAPQQDALMAQTEKYMLLEKEEMLGQKILSLEALLNAAAGRDIEAPIMVTTEISALPVDTDCSRHIGIANESSPEIIAAGSMAGAARSKAQLSEKEYYPDFTISANYFEKAPGLDDMWSLTAAVNVPIFYKKKQRQAVSEAKAMMQEAEYGLNTVRLMVSASIKERCAMMNSATRLMDLYKNGLIPKAYQDFELSLAGYVSGRGEAAAVISRLNAFISFETLYWEQFVEREKAAAALLTLTGQETR